MANVSLLVRHPMIGKSDGGGMKKTFLSLLIIFIANISYSQDSIDKIAIFEKSEKAIALVSIAVKIDSLKLQIEN